MNRQICKIFHHRMKPSCMLCFSLVRRALKINSLFAYSMLCLSMCDSNHQWFPFEFSVFDLVVENACALKNGRKENIRMQNNEKPRAVVRDSDTMRKHHPHCFSFGALRTKVRLKCPMQYIRTVL